MTISVYFQCPFYKTTNPLKTSIVFIIIIIVRQIVSKNIRKLILLHYFLSNYHLQKYFHLIIFGGYADNVNETRYCIFFEFLQIFQNFAVFIHFWSFKVERSKFWITPRYLTFFKVISSNFRAPLPRPSQNISKLESLEIE